MLHAAVVAVTLALAPYHGAALRGAVPGSRSFALAVHAPPGTRVHLRAGDLPDGYIASFCTPRICAPFAVRLAVDASGEATIELQIIRNDPHARPPRRVVVVEDGGARATIALDRGTMPGR